MAALEHYDVETITIHEKKNIIMYLANKSSYLSALPLLVIFVAGVLKSDPRCCLHITQKSWNTKKKFVSK